MDTMVSTYLKRSENELMIAEKLKILSDDEEAKDFMKIPEKITFYSAVISHSYYSIFYSAKAILLTKDIRTFSPEVHKKTFEIFREHFVHTGILDMKLLEI